jgi:hypothetical protein
MAKAIRIALDVKVLNIAAMSEEIDPVDEHDSASPSRGDIDSILAKPATIQQSAHSATEYIKGGDYESHDLQYAIHEIKEGAGTLLKKLTKHMTGVLLRSDFPKVDEID